jgi:hypothetical protein
MDAMQSVGTANLDREAIMDIFGNPCFDPDWVLDDAEDHFGADEQEPSIGEYWNDEFPDEEE